MRKNLWLSLLAITALMIGWVSGQQSAYADAVTGSGKVKDESRKISGIHRVSAYGVGLLHIEVGKTESLTIEAEDNILPLIQTKRSSDGTLEIGPKNNTDLNPTKPIRYRLCVKSLDGITLSGATAATAGAIVTKRNLDLDLSGVGSVSLDRLVADKLNVTGSGTSHIKIGKGEVHQLTLDLSGVSSYQAFGISSPVASVNASGASKVELTATRRLDASVSGVSQVRYKGKPTEGKRETSGVASVTAE